MRNNSIYHTVLLVSIVLLAVTTASAQDDWEAMLDNELDNVKSYTEATFKTTRVVFGQSIERMPKRGLDLRIAHRFGDFSNNTEHFYGLDQSNSFISLEYGINDKIMVGIGRATYRSTMNAFVKTALLRQSTGAKPVPLTVVWFSSMAYSNKTYSSPERNDYLAGRMDYVHQLLIARKFNKNFSLQLSPTMQHRNMVDYTTENNDLYAVGIGARYKLTNRISVNAEYFHLLNNNGNDERKCYPPLAVGFDLQAGSHVFQVFVTNAAPITTNDFLGHTESNFFDGEIRFGFNISQVFTL